MSILRNATHLLIVMQGTDVMQFVYDPDGQPFMMRLNGVDYYYTYNVQGDVVSLIDRSNTRVVEYRYDSWCRRGESVQIPWLCVGCGDRAVLSGKQVL